MKNRTLSETAPSRVSADAGASLTYAQLLQVVEEWRQAELREVNPHGKNHDAQVRGTLNALRALMAAVGRQTRDPVGAELLDKKGFTQSINLIARETGRSRSTISRIRSELNQRIQPWAERLQEDSSRDHQSETFSERLNRLIDCAGVTSYQLEKQLGVSHSLLFGWRKGSRTPSDSSLEVVKRLENILGAREGYLSSTVKSRYLSQSFDLSSYGIDRSQQRRISQHLPPNFNEKSHEERLEIVQWVIDNIVVSGNYEGDHSGAIANTYALCRPGASRRLKPAPDLLVREIDDIMAFKTAEFIPYGFVRNKKWSKVVSESFEQHIMMMMGALKSIGLPSECLSITVCLSPTIIDRYIAWRKTRSGDDHTRTIQMVLDYIEALLHPKHGYIFQSQNFANNLKEANGFIDQELAKSAKQDWAACCVNARTHIKNRLKEINELLVVKRDPFFPIISVLDAEDPLSEYLKIVDEIKRRTRDRVQTPVRWAEDQRAIMMIRIGLETGFRQKNLRQLLLCSGKPDPNALKRKLALAIYFDESLKAWRVVGPRKAIKNSDSSAFASRDLDFIIKDRDGLYRDIESWLEARKILLGDARSENFFIKSMRGTRAKAPEMNQYAYYNAFAATIARYGVYNPYTRKGAIPDLRVHGPHTIRDVLATAVIKRTGSYERAAAIIMDTVETVKNHYARWMPGEQFEAAQRSLDDVYEARANRNSEEVS